MKTNQNTQPILWATAVFFVIGILMSFKLWINTRRFPVIPINSNLPQLASPYDFICVGCLLCVLVLSCLFQKRFLIWGSLFLLLILLIQDQMRWQPWAYIYTLFLVPFGFKNPTAKKFNFIYFQLILIGIYLWSGIHKLNMNFVNIVFPRLILDAFNINIMKYKLLGFAVPVIEIGIGLGFIFRKTRKPAVVMAVLMHLFVIFTVNTKNGISNSIIIPWNIAMIAFCYFCFYKNPQNVHFKNLWKDSGGKLKTTLAVLSLALPLLYFWAIGTITSHITSIPEKEKAFV